MDFCAFLVGLLQINPAERFTAVAALEHRFLARAFPPRFDRVSLSSSCRLICSLSATNIRAPCAALSLFHVPAAGYGASTYPPVSPRSLIDLSSISNQISNPYLTYKSGEKKFIRVIYISSICYQTCSHPRLEWRRLGALKQDGRCK